MYRVETTDGYVIFSDSRYTVAYEKAWNESQRQGLRFRVIDNATGAKLAETKPLEAVWTIAA